MHTLSKLVVTLALLSLSLSASAQIGAKYTITNDTGGTGGTYPVTTLVTFNSLDLVETLTGGGTLDIPIYRNGVRITSLTPFNLSASTQGVDISSVSSATLTGAFSTTTWNIATSPGGSKTPVTVLADFSATITGVSTSRLVPIWGVNSTTGADYEAGQFNTSSAAIPVVTPEPSVLTLLVVMLLVGAWWRFKPRYFLRRRKRQTEAGLLSATPQAAQSQSS